jgi:hypothetical protein
MRFAVRIGTDRDGLSTVAALDDNGLCRVLASLLRPFRQAFVTIGSYRRRKRASAFV